MNPEPQIPDWKTPHHLWEKKKVEDAKESKLKDLLPKMAARIGWLDNPDEQLNNLCDYLQERGIPMGSKNWALKAENLFRRLEDERHAAYRILNQWRDKELPDFERFAADINQAAKIHAKRNPPMETRCDWCGWAGERYVGNGCNACFDCLPEEKENETT